MHQASAATAQLSCQRLLAAAVCIVLNAMSCHAQEEIFEIGQEGMSVAELSQRLATPAHTLLAKLFERGIAAHVNQVLTQSLTCVLCDCSMLKPVAVVILQKL